MAPPWCLTAASSGPGPAVRDGRAGLLLLEAARLLVLFDVGHLALPGHGSLMGRNPSCPCPASGQLRKARIAAVEDHRVPRFDPGRA